MKKSGVLINNCWFRERMNMFLDTECNECMGRGECGSSDGCCKCICHTREPSRFRNIRMANKRPRAYFAVDNRPQKKGKQVILVDNRGPGVNRGFARPGGYMPTMGAIRNQNLVKHRSGEEVKSVDTELSAPFSNAAGTSQLCVNYPVQGAAFYNRIGTRIKMKSLHVTGQIVPIGGAGVANNWDYARMLIYYDRQPGTAGAGAFPAVANLLLDYNSAGGTTTNNFSGLNLLLRDRYQIIRDIRRVLPPLGLAGIASTFAPVNAFDPANSFSINEFIRLGEMETHFNQTNGGTIADITTGALNILFIQGSGNAAWQFEGSCRLRYVDT